MYPTPLFRGKLVQLTAPIPDQDAEIESRWTQDLDFLHLISSNIARPISPQQVKKNYKEMEKADGKQFHFAIRLVEDQRLVGFLRFHHLEWNMGSGWLKLGIANPPDRGKGFGKEALALGLRYAFGELNLRRIAASVVDYNLPAIEMLREAGFSEEVRRREAYLRNGRRWDGLIFGLLREEWAAVSGNSEGGE